MNPACLLLLHAVHIALYYFKQVTVSNTAQKIPKITLAGITRACKILGCNSEYSRLEIQPFKLSLLYGFFPSRLKCLPLCHSTSEQHILAICFKFGTFVDIYYTNKNANFQLCKSSGF